MEGAMSGDVILCLKRSRFWKAECKIADLLQDAFKAIVMSGRSLNQVESDLELAETVNKTLAEKIVGFDFSKIVRPFSSFKASSISRI